MATIAEIQDFKCEDAALPSSEVFGGAAVKTPSRVFTARDNHLLRCLLVSLFIHGAAFFAVFVFFLHTPASGVGQSFVLVEVSGLLGDGAAGAGAVSGEEAVPLSVGHDKAEVAAEKISLPLIKVVKKEAFSHEKRPSIRAAVKKEAKVVKEAREVKTTASSLTTLSAAQDPVTDKAAVEEDKPLNKRAISLESTVPVPHGETSFLFSEDSPMPGDINSQSLTGESSLVSYSYHSEAEPGSGAAGDKRAEGGEQSRGRSGTGSAAAVIEGLQIPPYPPFSRLRGEDGRVKLQVQIGADGRHSHIKVLSSSGFARLDRAALKALERARFIPATSNGRPTASTKTVVFVFKLKD